MPSCTRPPHRPTQTACTAGQPAGAVPAPSRPSPVVPVEARHVGTSLAGRCLLRAHHGPHVPQLGCLVLAVAQQVPAGRGRVVPAALSAACTCCQAVQGPMLCSRVALVQQGHQGVVCSRWVTCQCMCHSHAGDTTGTQASGHMTITAALAPHLPSPLLHRCVSPSVCPTSTPAGRRTPLGCRLSHTCTAAQGSAVRRRQVTAARYAAAQVSLCRCRYADGWHIITAHIKRPQAASWQPHHMQPTRHQAPGTTISSSPQAGSPP